MSINANSFKSKGIAISLSQPTKQPLTPKTTITLMSEERQELSLLIRKMSVARNVTEWNILRRACKLEHKTKIISALDASGMICVILKHNKEKDAITALLKA